MGVDITGTNTKGVFNSGWPRWEATWNYCCKIAPELTGKIKNPFYNYGEGLSIRDSKTLSKIIKKEMMEGNTKKYFKLNHKKDASWYIKSVTEFSEFLQNCDGFEIW